MTQHFTRSTQSASLWCSKCQKYTQHRIDDRRKGPCLECIAKLEALHNAPKPEPEKQMGLFATLVVTLLLSLPSFSQADFWVPATLAISATAGDSYETGQFQRNYQAWYSWRGAANDHRFNGVCMTEGSQPLLYGKHPGELRAWSVGAGKVAAAMGLSLWARKSKKFRRLSSVPLLILAADSGVGAISNWVRCR
jgi:hypothetical protein